MGKKHASGRRQIHRIVTTEAIDRERRELNGYLISVAHSFEPPIDEAEAARRRAVHREGLDQLLLAALVCLQEFNPSHRVALLDGARRFVEAGIRGDTVPFTVRRPPRAKEHRDHFLRPFIEAEYQFVRRRLEEAWRDAAPRRPRRRRRAQGERVGAAQREGLARKRASTQRKVDVVREIMKERAKVDVSESTVRRWIKVDETPAGVSRRMLGHVMGLRPSTVETHLRKARELYRRGEERTRILELWGYRRQGPGSS